jgi:phthalate 4,5-dioxygenase oxygenase subunit
MLTAEENDLLCRVEGDAPMGRMMRRYWIPACLSEEISEPDSDPCGLSLPSALSAVPRAGRT